MAIPTVNIIWDDQSAINKIDNIAEDNVDRPIIMVASTADKGPEEWKHKVFGDDFYKYYGETPSFARHGQPLIQAANAIDAGAYVTFKRVVASDATLANIGIVANVSYKAIAYEDETTGMKVYEKKDPANNNKVTRVFAQSAPDGYTEKDAVQTNQVNVQFQAVTYNLGSTSSGGGATNDPAAFANQLFNTYHHTGSTGSNNQTYPLFMITDNGRGVSKKRFRISRDTTVSKPVSYVRYFIEIMEGDKTLETLAFTLNPDIIEKDRNINLQNVVKMQSKQLRCIFFDDEYTAFCKNVAFLLNTTTSELNSSPLLDTVTYEEFARQDPIFGTDFYGKKYRYLNCDYDILNNVFGIELQNGSNGAFGDTPIKAETYASEMKRAFIEDDDIYDVDNNRIDAIFDANYPSAVKRAIEDLAAFREDFMYFRDMGLGLRSLGNIKVMDEYNLKSRFCATYMNSYDIYDPYTRKQISVTIMYDLVRLFVKHFINGRARPFCGIKFDIYIPQDNFVEGTLNFSPKNTPKGDQRQTLDDLRINYASYNDGNILAVASEYTSQTDYTQLSFINNVLAIQQVIKAIRVLCPKIRYSFADGEDIQNYRRDIKELIIDRYSSLFQSFDIEYVENSQYASNKIFYAILKVQLRNFYQTEIFKITALQS